jgi:hypothetical protein
MKISGYLRKQFESVDAADRPIDAEEHQMIAIVADAAQQGKDIATLFPKFWQSLLGNRRLQSELLDFIDILTAQEGAVDLPLLRSEISFLDTVPPQPQRQQWSAEKWRVKWHQTIGQLRTLIEQPIPTQRRVRVWSRDIQLLENHLSLEAGTLDVLLKVTHTTGSNQLVPTLIAHHSTAKLIAHLHWGSYSDTIETRQTTTEFAPVWLDQIGDGTLTGIANPLELTIEPHPDDSD